MGSQNFPLKNFSYEVDFFFFWGGGGQHPAPEGCKIGTPPPSDVFDTFPKNKNLLVEKKCKVKKKLVDKTVVENKFLVKNS